MAARQQKKRAFHEAVLQKTQKKFSKDATQKKKREKELLHEYLKARRTNAFLDRRAGSAVKAFGPNKRTKAEKFVLEDTQIFGSSDALGLPSVDAVPDDSGAVNLRERKQDQLAKYKQARAEHFVQVQEDLELTAQLDAYFKWPKTKEALAKLLPRAQGGHKTDLEKEDVEFNEFLTMFSLPSGPSRTLGPVLKAKPLDGRLGRGRDGVLVRADGEEVPLIRRVDPRDGKEGSDSMEEVLSERESVLEDTPFDSVSESEEPGRTESLSAELSSQSVVSKATGGSLDADEDESAAEAVVEEAEQPELPEAVGGGNQSQPAEEAGLLPVVCSPRELDRCIREMQSKADLLPQDQKITHQKEILAQLLDYFTSLRAGEGCLSQMDVLTRHISQTTQKLAEEGLSPIKDKITRLSRRFCQLLPDEWPSLSEILFLKMLLSMFPPTQDFDPISQSIALLMCHFLSQGKRKTELETVLGLFVASLLQKALGNRFCPEVLAFYTDLLTEMPKRVRDSGESVMTPFKVRDLLEGPAKTRFPERAIFRSLMGVRYLSESYQKAACFPEVFAPVTRVLEAACTSGGLSGELLDLCRKESLALRTAIVDRASSREPLCQSEDPTVGIAQRRPVFEERLDIDEMKRWKEREMTDRRTLKRKLTKERRGAIKELRKDGSFLAQVREAEKREVDKQRLKSERSFFSELQQFDRDFRQGGQAGMNPHLKGKKKRLWRY